MARLPRKPERSDFSALLEELNGDSSAAEANTSIIPQAKDVVLPEPDISPEKRKRDSLLSNPKMRYAFSASERVLHDRDCFLTQKISDQDFRMTDAFTDEMPFCPKCYRKGLVRSAVTDDFKRINAYLNALNLMKASNKDLYALIIENHARFFDIALDYIGLRVHEDKWYVILQNQGIQLYHNNYRVYGDYERVFTNGYHLQEDGGIHTFHNFLNIMTRYSWTGHVESIKLRLRAEKRIKYRKYLERVPNVIRKNRPLSLFAHFVFVDCQNKSRRYFSRKNIQPRIYEVNEISSTPYSVVSCKVWRWESSAFLSAMDSLKDYAAETDHFTYAEHCRVLFPQI